MTAPVLPIRAYASDIVAAIRSNDIVVVIGETGSGKTTQISQVSSECKGLVWNYFRLLAFAYAKDAVKIFNYQWLFINNNFSLLEVLVKQRTAMAMHVSIILRWSLQFFLFSRKPTDPYNWKSSTCVVFALQHCWQQILLEAGLAADGMIAVTQPRRVVSLDLNDLTTHG